ncbi:MAG: hypothetical protein AB8G26_18265 [Ilumatobacter sp.]
MTPIGTASTTASCCARAALAGNPSDMYGGAVVATPIPPVRASVSVESADTFAIDGIDHAAATVAELDELVARPPTSGDRPLVAAAIVALARETGIDIAPLRTTVTTAIPRSVGLAGSSAIVIAALRAVVAHSRDDAWATGGPLDPVRLATIALVAERDLLGIKAGMQDRLVQAYEHTLLMDFSGAVANTRAVAAAEVSELGHLPGVWFVACRPDTAADSGAVHQAGDTKSKTFLKAMASLGDHARDAAQAIRSSDVGQLRRAVDATFDLRASALLLDPAHVEMVDLARSGGASATYTGSGGAVAVVADDVGIASRVAERLRSIGCFLLPLGTGFALER